MCRPATRESMYKVHYQNKANQYILSNKIRKKTHKVTKEQPLNLAHKVCIQTHNLMSLS